MPMLLNTFLFRVKIDQFPIPVEFTNAPVPAGQLMYVIPMSLRTCLDTFIISILHSYKFCLHILMAMFRLRILTAMSQLRILTAMFRLRILKAMFLPRMHTVIFLLLYLCLCLRLCSPRYIYAYAPLGIFMPMFPTVYLRLCSCSVYLWLCSCIISLRLDSHTVYLRLCSSTINLR